MERKDRLTLRTNENERNFSGISIVRHLSVIVVDGVEGCLVFQAEHENYGVYPCGELQQQRNRLNIEIYVHNKDKQLVKSDVKTNVNTEDTQRWTDVQN